MTVKERYSGVLAYFETDVPVAESELNFADAFQLLVAVLLSAQCTDRRVNLVTPALFAAYPTPEALSRASAGQVHTLIRSISYPNSKAEHLVSMAGALTERFGGEVPSDVDSLMSLPGVGRKTANVVASIIYNVPVIAVDTHVFRVAHRLGLSSGKNPEAVEKDLEKYVPERLRPICHHWLMLFGRYTCTAQKPHCDVCPLTRFCTVVRR